MRQTQISQTMQTEAGWFPCSQWIKGVLLFFLLVLIPACCCASAAAAQGFWTRFEQSVGDNAYPQIVARYGGSYTLPLHEQLWLEAIFDRLTQQAARTELDYSLTLLESTSINAFALPGGYVFLTRGFLERLDHDADTLAFVLGHEIAHIEHKHGLEAVGRQLGLTLLMELGLARLDLDGEAVRTASAAAVELVQAGWGREAEYEADELGLELAAAAGFNPFASVRLLEQLLAWDERAYSLDVFASHPPTTERRDRLADQVLCYWSSPEPAERPPKARSERPAGLDLELTPREAASLAFDPAERFVLYIANGSETDKPTLRGLDTQRGTTLDWLAGQTVSAAAWSPHGDVVAAAVHVDPHWEIWFLNRFGHVVKTWRKEEGVDFLEPVWAPDGQHLAYVRLEQGDKPYIWVGHRDGTADIPISQGLDGDAPLWDDRGVIFRQIREDKVAFFRVQAPAVNPVVLENPVPVVLQRKQRVAPDVISDNGVLRLRRPDHISP